MSKRTVWMVEVLDTKRKPYEPRRWLNMPNLRRVAVFRLDMLTAWHGGNRAMARWHAGCDAGWHGQGHKRLRVVKVEMDIKTTP